jgi:hypothetical protein
MAHVCGDMAVGKMAGDGKLRHPWSERCRHAVWRYVCWRVGPTRFEDFFWYSKSAQTLKFKMRALLMSKNTQTWHGARFEYFEQLSQSGWLQIPNKIHIIILWIDLNLNLLLFLKGLNPCEKNLRNSPKFYLDLVFITVNLVGHTFMQKIWVSIQVSMIWFEYKKRVWIWNSNHTTPIIQTKSYKDFIQASKLYSKLLFKQCSSYSGTRSVTAYALSDKG